MKPSTKSAFRWRRWESAVRHSATVSRFNLIVNDNDGQGRKGWIQVAPGLGGNKDAEQYPFVVFEE